MAAIVSVGLLVAAPVLVGSAASLQEQTVLAGSDTGDAAFGDSVAIDGDTVLVGAWGHREDGVNHGAAYVFTRSDGSWTQQAKLVASNLQERANFGFSVDLDGDTAVVGAQGKDGTEKDQGAVYVFTRSGGSWTQQAKLTAENVEHVGHVGRSVGIDGDTVVAGADLAESGGVERGAVYVWTRSGGSWTQQAKLTASDGEDTDWLGQGVGIEGDTVAGGAVANDAGGNNRGAVYVWTRSGGSWSEQAKLTGSQTDSNSGFGRSIAFDGGTVVVGAAGQDEYDTDSGAAYAFSQTNGSWSEQAMLAPSDLSVTDGFGDAVAVDGDTVVVGAAGQDGPRGNTTNLGAAYVFERSGSTWSQVQKLTASDGRRDDHFGGGAAVHSGTVLVGAPGDDHNNSGSRTGSVYVFGSGTDDGDSMQNGQNGGDGQDGSADSTPGFGALAALAAATVAVWAVSRRRG